MKIYVGDGDEKGGMDRGSKTAELHSINYTTQQYNI